MGQSPSNDRRRYDAPIPPTHPSSATIPAPSPPAPLLSPPPPPQQQQPPPPTTPPPPPRPNYSTPYLMPMPQPAPYGCTSSYYHQQQSNYPGRSSFQPPQYYVPSRRSGWWYPPPTPPQPQQSWSYGASSVQHPPLPHIEHQKAKMVKNNVNVHKDTIRLVPDEQNPDQHLVAFTYDAMVDGSVTIYYFAKEGKDCHFFPLYPELYAPERAPFQKGVDKKFVQPFGSGIDFGFFTLDDLSQPLQGDVFPLVIYAEASEPSSSNGEQVDQSSSPLHAQITVASIEKNSDVSFQVKAVKQILWVDSVRYELQDIFGIVNSVEPAENDGEEDDVGKECVICLSEPRDTAVLPCRHMCMCSECAKALTQQSNKCPVCRQPIQQLMEIKVNGTDPKLTEQL